MDPTIQEWEEAQHRIWIYRLARIAQRAGDATKIWAQLQAFKPTDRDRLWDDTLGSGEWRSSRAICYAFEALERWAIKAGGQNVFPVSIEALVQLVSPTRYYKLNLQIHRRKICSWSLQNINWKTKLKI